MYEITQEQKAPWETAVRYNKSRHEKCDQIRLSKIQSFQCIEASSITRPTLANQTTFKHIQTHQNSVRYAERFYKLTRQTEGTRKTTMHSTPLPSQHQTSLPQCTFLHNRTLMWVRCAMLKKNMRKNIKLVQKIKPYSFVFNKQVWK